jgi:ribulose-bisphosphate carboxylase large chain
MNTPESSCEIGASSAPAASGSRILSFLPSEFRWQGVPAMQYKEAAKHWQGVARMTLVGQGGEGTAFEMRYFEISPGGFSSLEHHAHEHAVFVLRGDGRVRLGAVEHDLHFGDFVYVAPHEAHQFRNTSSAEPFGFLCVVDAHRDLPVPLAAGKAIP